MEGKAQHDVAAGPRVRRPVRSGDDAMIASREAAACLTFVCSYCSRGFFSQQALGAHLKAHMIVRNPEYVLAIITSSSLPIHWLHGARAISAAPVAYFTWAPDNDDIHKAAVAPEMVTLRL